MHENQVIAYASKSLNACQKNYAQIEKELLAVLFGCNRFHQYLYGQTVLVETDHQPLVSLFKKPLSEVPQRLQRMMMKLQAYDLIVSYKAGKQMYIADTLSRAPLKNDELSEHDNNLEGELRIHANLLIQSLAVSEQKLEKIKGN